LPLQKQKLAWRLHDLCASVMSFLLSSAKVRFGVDSAFTLKIVLRSAAFENSLRGSP
jgi:hypothetical protein